MVLSIVHLSYYLQEISIFLGFPVFMAGIIGNILCMVVFFSFQRSQKSSCPFYLICVCGVCLLKLVTGLFPRLVLIMIHPAWLKSLLYCKYVTWLCDFCSSNLLICLCLAAVNHYLGTSGRPSWQYLSTLKMAYHIIGTTMIVRLLQAVPYMFMWNLDDGHCVLKYPLVSEYVTEVYIPLVLGILSIFIMNLFTFLSIRNVRNSNQEGKSILVEKNLNSDLSKMLLAHVGFISLMHLLYVSHFIYLLNVDLSDASVMIEQERINGFLHTVWDLSYAVRSRLLRNFHYSGIFHSDFILHLSLLFQWVSKTMLPYCICQNSSCMYA